MPLSIEGRWIKRLLVIETFPGLFDFTEGKTIEVFGVSFGYGF